MMSSIKDIHEAIWILKSTVAQIEHVRDSEKTNHLEIDNSIQVHIGGQEYLVNIERPNHHCDERSKIENAIIRYFDENPGENRVANFFRYISESDIGKLWEDLVEDEVIRKSYE